MFFGKLSKCGEMTVMFFPDYQIRVEPIKPGLALMRQGLSFETSKLPGYTVT
jgi:hypothetical protein